MGAVIIANVKARSLETTALQTQVSSRLGDKVGCRHICPSMAYLEIWGVALTFPVARADRSVELPSTPSLSSMLFSEDTILLEDITGLESRVCRW